VTESVVRCESGNVDGVGVGVVKLMVGSEYGPVAIRGEKAAGGTVAVLECTVRRLWPRC
jgi:hypothetical protein